MVIDLIVSQYQSDSFDFREYANPDDELAHLFEDWVPYYRMKHAICKTLRPSSILEIGVRYGYSAITFLHAAPNARYLGIDNDTSTFGGSTGAIRWAQEITCGYDAEFIIADSQVMTSFPGDCWDLIHIDGQQDGDGTFHDLELALPRAKWILLDGYFWTNENMFSSTHFLKKYSQFVDYAIVIPGYAGDLLIKIQEGAKPLHNSNRSYIELPFAYNHEYFLNDCGSHESFKRTRGQELEDPRLIATYLLADPLRGKRILDLGCGRGELCFALAQGGADVTGIDYSSAAIDIANNTYGLPETEGMLTFLCADAVRYPLIGRYDAIVATDFVEHIEESAFEQILQNCSDHLKPDGRLILHTSPNRHYYEKAYPVLRQKAQEAGCYLPVNPRTYYEDLMHINEQTPGSLQSMLSRFFAHVCVWVTGVHEMAGSLFREYSQDEIDNAQSIFAVASHVPIRKEELMSLLSQKPLDTGSLSVEIEILEIPRSLQVNRSYTFQVRISNRGRESLKSLPPNPVHISYHWFDTHGKAVIYDGIRTAIQPSLAPESRKDFFVAVHTPLDPGNYILQVTLVQEFRFWFEEMVPDLPLSVECDIQNNLSEEKTNFIIR